MFYGKKILPINARPYRIRTLYALLRANPTDSLAKCVDLFYKRTNPNGFIRFEPIIRIIYRKILRGYHSKLIRHFFSSLDAYL